MMHCHHLEHEDRGVIGQFIIDRSKLDPATVAPTQPIGF